MLDTVPPASSVLGPNGTQPCSRFVVAWAGQGEAGGSGVGGDDVYVDHCARTRV